MMIKITADTPDGHFEEIVDGDTLRRQAEALKLEPNIYRLACYMRPGTVRTTKVGVSTVKIRRMS